MINKIPFAYRITILYILFGALWILFSDSLVARFTADPDVIRKISMFKGWLYVLVTGILLFFLIMKEIRRRTQVYNQLLDSKKQADEAVRLKSTFLANLSHYIRTPMNSILGFVELIEDKDTSPENQQLFQSYITESSQNLLQTLSSIVEIARLQEGQVEVARAEVSAAELIGRVAAAARVDLAARRKLLEVQTGKSYPDGPDRLVTDPDKVIMILLALVSNSIRFTQQGVIGIAYEGGHDSFLFRVSDTGGGILAEKQATLFTDFLQHDPLKGTPGQGAGLGLALASRLAAILGGALRLENTGPGGTTFCLSLPA
jgi:signal transduction histidine kinase